MPGHLSWCRGSAQISRRLGACVLAAIAALLVAGLAMPARAQTPPVLTITPMPPIIALNGTSTLSFVVINNNNVPLTGIGFTLTLPAGLTVQNAASAACNPSGVVTSTAPNSIVLSNTFTMPALSSCNFVRTVTGTALGPQSIVTSAISSNEAGPGAPGTALITVVGTASAITLVSSKNPSSFGETVTFTATVSGNVPTGTVTFSDGATVLGTSTLNGSGQAALTTSSLAVGSHSITASYSGDANNGASAASLTQTVGVPLDSVKLRAMQIVGTQIEALSSGRAVSGAIDAAIGEGFGTGAPVTASDNGFHVNFAAEPQERRSAAQARVGDAFAAFGDAADEVYKAPPRAAPTAWLPWADVRGTGWSTSQEIGDIRGGQINALLGLSRRLAPDLLVGVFGGYENFDYTSQLLDGRLKGEGWTAGGYLGWRLLPGVRFDAGVARSGVDYDGSAGTASASFPGRRWIATAALIGTYRLPQGFELEPSLKAYAVWEREDAYTDSLGTLQAERNFSNGRASAGARLAYPWLWSGTTTFTPYAGLYADYYFNRDDATLPAAPLLLPMQFVHGLSARLTAGVGLDMAGAKLSVGGEVGGLGSGEFTNWSVRGRAAVPF